MDNGTGAKVKPKTDVVLQKLTVGEPTTQAAPAPTGPASGAPSASPSAG